jgi:hypothetical protein
VRWAVEKERLQTAAAVDLAKDLASRRVEHPINARLFLPGGLDQKLIHLIAKHDGEFLLNIKDKDGPLFTQVEPIRPHSDAVCESFWIPCGKGEPIDLEHRRFSRQRSELVAAMPKKSRPNERGQPVRQDIDRDMIRKLAMIGCSHQEIANRVGCSRKTLEQRFRSEIEEGQSDGRVQARAKIFQKGVVNGEFASLEFYLINQCGWSRKPEVQATTNVIQNTGNPRSPEQV